MCPRIIEATVAVDIVGAVPKDQVPDVGDLAVMKRPDVSTVMIDAFDTVGRFGAIKGVCVGEQGKAEACVHKGDVAGAIEAKGLSSVAQDFLRRERLCCGLYESLAQKRDVGLRGQLPEWKARRSGPLASDGCGRCGR